MGKMKELFMQFKTEMQGNDEYVDDDFQFQVWLDEKEKQFDEQSEMSGSIFPADLFYDDEYYKSTYIPTKEEEEEVFKIFNKE